MEWGVDCIEVECSGMEYSVEQCRKTFYILI